MNVNDPRWASIDAFVEENRDNILRDITRLVAVPSVEGAPEPGAPFGPGPKAALSKALEISDTDERIWNVVSALYQKTK